MTEDTKQILAHCNPKFHIFGYWFWFTGLTFTLKSVPKRQPHHQLSFKGVFQTLKTKKILNKLENWNIGIEPFTSGQICLSSWTKDILPIDAV